MPLRRQRDGLFALWPWVGLHAHVGCISRLSASQQPIAMRFGLGTGRQLTLRASVIQLFVVVLGPYGLVLFGAFVAKQQNAFA